MKNSELKLIAQKVANKIQNAKLEKEFFHSPFKHVVIDHAFPQVLAKQALNGIPSTQAEGWDYSNDSDIEVKYRSTWKSEFDVPDEVLPIIRILNSSTFLNAMSKRFEIKKLVPDCYFTGGGINVTERGGLLDVHVDGNYHDATGLNRRLNAILYLNEDWAPEWGGDFGLYDETGEELIKKVPPLFNRLVIFDTHDKSFHGLPEPLNFPKGKSRKSIILYYYTKEERPKNLSLISEPHSALWKKRDGLDKRGSLTRDYE